MEPIEKRIESVVDTILADYGLERDIDRMQTSRRPDRDVIVEVISKLRRTAFITPKITSPSSSRM